MTSERTFKLVVGYHRNTPVPSCLLELGLLSRTALVLESNRSWSPEIVFDAELLITLLAPIDRYFGSAVTFAVRMYEPERRAVFVGLPELRAFFSEVGAEAEIPEEATWSRDGVVVAKGFSERWDLVGGPAIYHDSLTFSIYTRAPIPDTVLMRMRQAASQMGAEMTELLHGVDRPLRISRAAITALVVGFLSFFTGMFGVLTGLIGAALGIFALRHIRGNALLAGRKIAIAGLLASSLAVLLSLAIYDWNSLLKETPKREVQLSGPGR